MSYLTLLMTELIRLLFTVTLFMVILWAQFAVPRLFFWIMWILARRTPIGYILEWRRCLATYYTSNTTEESAHEIVDLVLAKDHYKSVGLAPPRNFDGICTVDEEILFVSFAGRFVGWSNLAPKRMRVFGMLHDKSILYGVWSDWHSDTRFRGTLLLELDKDRSTGGRGVWVGAAKGGSSNKDPSGIRTFPWIWNSFDKVSPYSKFQTVVPQTGETTH